MGLYEVPLLGFWEGDCGSQHPYMWYYVVVKSGLKHARRECESRRVYVFRCLMFCLSGSCEFFKLVLLPLRPELW